MAEAAANKLRTQLTKKVWTSETTHMHHSKRPWRLLRQTVVMVTETFTYNPSDVCRLPFPGQPSLATALHTSALTRVLSPSSLDSCL